MDRPVIEGQRIRLRPEDDWEEVVYPYLLGQVFHSTPHYLLKGIRASGEIRAGNPKTALGKWQTNNYGRFKGYVCLYDFRVPREDIKDHAFKCHPCGREREQALLILKPSEWPHLIPNSQALAELGGYTMTWLPRIEVWLKSPVSLDNIAKIIRVRRAAEWPSDEPSFADMLKRAEKARKGFPMFQKKKVQMTEAEKEEQ